jgi:cbb3-type cytochrome oxidase subunit 3
MPSYLKFAIILVLAGVVPLGFAQAQPLAVSIQSEVDDVGHVKLALIMKNSSLEPVYHVRPMFHFHHSMSMMSKIMRLDPGQSISLENDQHPPVVRVGRYPLTAMVEYWTHPTSGSQQSVLVTDSFFFKEPVKSQVEGRLESATDSNSSILKVFLQNRSASFKNIRMMLVLPRGVETRDFSDTMGFTMHGGEEKNFEVRVFRRENQEQDRFPVRLMIEYGEMLKHYSGEITGTVRFSPSWYSLKYMPHFTALAFMALVLLGYYYRIYNQKWKGSFHDSSNG